MRLGRIPKKPFPDRYNGWRVIRTHGRVFGIPPTADETRSFDGKVRASATLQFRVSRIRWDQDYDATGALVATGYPPDTDFQSLFGF